MSKHLDSLEPEFRTQIETLIFRLQEEKGVKVIPVQGRRTLAYQNELYAKGRTTPGEVVTNAKGGSSPHNFGLACDLCPVKENGECDWNDKNPGWKIMADMAVEMGLVSGRYFKSIYDPPHVESPGWRKVQLAWKRGEIQIA